MRGIRLGVTFFMPRCDRRLALSRDMCMSGKVGCFMLVALIVTVPFLIREVSQFYGECTDNDYTRFCPEGCKKFFLSVAQFAGAFWSGKFNPYPANVENRVSSYQC